MTQMTAQELAGKLEGRIYREEITQEEEQSAKVAGLVVVYASRYDLAEFHGALYAEVKRPEETPLFVNSKGVMQRGENFIDDELCEKEVGKYIERKICSIQVTSSEDENSTCILHSDVPHSHFRIFDNGLDKTLTVSGSCSALTKRIET